MLRALSNLTCRVLYGVAGAVVAARRDEVTLKDALATFRLLASAHTEGISIEIAIKIATRAHAHKLDPFDLWVLYEAPDCYTVDDALLKALEMRAFFEVGGDPLDRTTLT